MNVEISRQSAVIGGESAARPGRKYVIEAKNLTSVEQAVPVRIVHGRDRVAGVHVCPVFQFGSEEITTEVGK